MISFKAAYIWVVHFPGSLPYENFSLVDFRVMDLMGRTAAAVPTAMTSEKVDNSAHGI